MRRVMARPELLSANEPEAGQAVVGNWQVCMRLGDSLGARTSIHSILATSRVSDVPRAGL
ncbi:MAG: hypothetical protein KatS3mg056_3773 [Chloroflexus sp.]|nr:MAG: hypothetical protein KatS3mg056_3773 [Chloroflexus sp.]